MNVESRLLEELAGFRDETAGFEERFLTPTVGGARTVAVLSRPIGERSSRMVWVICHSFGVEQMWMQPAEVALARTLARSGHAAVRYHSQGYADSEGRAEDITLSSHVADAAEAFDVAREVAGTDTVGLVGGRFGGSVAALTAERRPASALVLWDPIVDGRRYMNGLLRAAAVTQMSTAGRADVTDGNAQEDLAAGGLVDVQGFPLNRAMIDEASRLDLRRDLSRFAGGSLLLQVSKSRTPRKDLSELAEHLERIGGMNEFDIIVDEAARSFGQQRFHASSDGRFKADAQAAMSDALIGRTVSWIRSRAGGTARIESEAG